jgi:non-specific protein-tyrosine kinase
MEQPTNYAEEFIDLRQYARILWRWAWLMILCAVLAGAAAFFVSRATTPIYQATTTLLINQAPDARSTDYTDLLTSERLASTYSEMLTQRPVLSAVIARLELETSLDDLGDALEVQPVSNTQLITLTVEDENPYTAAEIADAIVAEFQAQNNALQLSRYAESKASLEAQLSRLDTQIGESEAAIAALGTVTGVDEQAQFERLQSDLALYQSSYSTLLQSYEALRVAEAGAVSGVVAVEPAEPDFDPVRPRTFMNTLLAAVVGGMLGLGAVFLIEYLDDTIKSPEQVERELGLPVLATIAAIPHNHVEGHVHAADQPRSPVAEAFRSLRTNIKFASVDVPIHTLLITSAGPEEGKSTVTTNLGAVMAHGGRQVVILEADLRRPRVHKLLGLSRGYGLSDLFVQDKLSLDGALQQTEIPGLQALASGDLPPNPAELLGSERMTSILELLIHTNDMVILDSSPAAVVTDPVVLAEKVDAVLLVIEPGKTELAAGRHAVTALKRAGANLIGVVFNNVPLKRSGYYGGYKYQYAYSYEEEQVTGDRFQVSGNGYQEGQDPEP